MKKKHIILITIIVLALLVSLTIALTFDKETSSSPTLILTACNSLVDNGPNSISLVLFTTKEKAEQYMNYFLNLVPFKNYSDKFSFFYIDENSYKPKCELYKGIAYYCYNRETLKKAASCRYDYIAVIGDQPKSIRSSAFSGLMSLNGKHPFSVFAHEFGHVFRTNFAEEYFTDAKIPKGSENCQKECSGFDKFEGDFGCFEECTNENYVREENEGLMRSLSSATYGAYDALLLEEAINLIVNEKTSNPLTGLAIQNINECEDSTYDLIEGIYSKENKNIEILSKETLSGCAGKGAISGILNYKVLSETNQEVLSGSFYPEYIFITEDDDTPEITSPPAENDKRFIITIPETADSDKLQFLDEQGEIIAETSLYDVGASPCRT